MGWRPAAVQRRPGPEGCDGDGKQISKVAGPGVPVALPLRGEAFAPGSLRYVTMQDGKLVLEEAGADEVRSLADLPQAGTPPTRVAWAPGGEGSQPASCP